MNQTATPTAQDWRARATALAINGHAFIDGRYVDAASGETFDDVTPIDGRVIARVASTDKADVERAVDELLRDQPDLQSIPEVGDRERSGAVAPILHGGRGCLVHGASL